MMDRAIAVACAPVQSALAKKAEDGFLSFNQTSILIRGL
jgi:hypothetical protein